MKLAIAVKGPQGLQEVWDVTDSVVRIGAAEDMSIRVAGLAPQAVTITSRDHRVHVIKRCSQSIRLAGKLLTTSKPALWRVGQILELGEGVSLELVHPTTPMQPLRSDARPVDLFSPAEEDQPTEATTTSGQKSRLYMLVAAVVLLTLLLPASQSTDGQIDDNFTQGFSAAAKVEHPDVKNLVELIRRARWEELFGEPEKAQRLYSRASSLASTLIENGTWSSTTAEYGVVQKFLSLIQVRQGTLNFS